VRNWSEAVSAEDCEHVSYLFDILLALGVDINLNIADMPPALISGIANNIFKRHGFT